MSKNAQKRVIVAATVLDPVVTFLARAGLQRDEISLALDRVWSLKRPKPAPAEFTKLSNPQPFVDLIAEWTTNPALLTQLGEPRDLSVRGLNGFNNLVRRASSTLNPKTARKVLQGLGNVEILENKKLRLVRPFFHVRGNDLLAFEPSVTFLLDAARNVRGPLNRSRVPNKERRQHFWRSVDNRDIPARHVVEFLSFIKSHSLSFLQDIDQWLACRANGFQRRGKRKSSFRLGVGLFTFESRGDRE